MQCGECGRIIPDTAHFCPQCGAKIAHEGEGASQNVGGLQVPGTTGDKRKIQRRQRSNKATFFLCLLGIAIVFVVEVIAVVVGMLAGLDLTTCGYVGSVVGTVAAIAAMHGASLLVPSANAMRVTLRTGWWAIAVSALLMCFDLASSLATGSFALADGWPLNVIGIALMCLAIGISEEGMFRGLLLGGLLSILGKTKRGVTRAVVISSVAFGLAHIDWIGLDYADPLSLLQALLKVIQTGVYGYYLGAVVVATGSIVGSVFLHALDNFLLMFVSIGLLGSPLSTDYVSTEADAVPTIVLYAIVIVLYVPLVVQGRKLLRQVPEPCLGAFVRKD